uniref:Phospholipid/glycerol acyltransferase domain-containing protein n=1 Tax=Capra hircus TaxID=9925 RepID=A0A8C2QZU0_CAPHI
MDGTELAGQILYTWLTLVFGLILLPSAFGVSLGISEIYMKILVKTLEWATLRIETGVAKQSALKNSASIGIIQRDESPMEKGLSGLRGRDFELSDVFYFSKKGLEAIVEDEVTQRFSSEELVSWNLLTRTNVNFQYVSPRLTAVWVLGVIVRYCVLLPLRCVSPGLLFPSPGDLPDSGIEPGLKNLLSELVHLTCCRICVRKGGICVANHTSPIDVLILTTDGCYTMVGQVHGGLMGIIQRAMVKACPHVWFERSEMKDRHLVVKRLKEHIAHKKELPILIFPEGTCINNTSVMMFKKGSFEIGGTIHPVAIKVRQIIHSHTPPCQRHYLLRVMTSWAIVCDVWYMPPMTREEGEDAVQFANRVKSAIAVQGGLTELPWDGGLKRAKVKDAFKEEQMVVSTSSCQRWNPRCPFWLLLVQH